MQDYFRESIIDLIELCEARKIKITYRLVRKDEEYQAEIEVGGHELKMANANLYELLSNIREILNKRYEIKWRDSLKTWSDERPEEEGEKEMEVEMDLFKMETCFNLLGVAKPGYNLDQFLQTLPVKDFSLMQKLEGILTKDFKPENQTAYIYDLKEKKILKKQSTQNQNNLMWIIKNWNKEVNLIKFQKSTSDPREYFLSTICSSILPKTIIDEFRSDQGAIKHWPCDIVNSLTSPCVNFKGGTELPPSSDWIINRELVVDLTKFTQIKDHHYQTKKLYQIAPFIKVPLIVHIYKTDNSMFSSITKKHVEYITCISCNNISVISDKTSYFNFIKGQIIPGTYSLTNPNSFACCYYQFGPENKGSLTIKQLDSGFCFYSTDGSQNNNFWFINNTDTNIMSYSMYYYKGVLGKGMLEWFRATQECVEELPSFQYLNEVYCRGMVKRRVKWSNLLGSRSGEIEVVDLEDFLRKVEEVTPYPKYIIVVEGEKWDGEWDSIWDGVQILLVKDC